MNLPSKQRHSKQAGFTLIELLIAISISAVISVLGYQAINQVVAVKSHTDQRLESFDDLQRVVWWLEQDLTQMAPRPILDTLGDKLPALLSSAQLGVEWSRIADYPSPYNQGGLLRVGYQLEDKKLYRLLWQVMDRVPDSEPKKIMVMENVVSFQLKWLNAKNQWQAEWPLDQQAITDLPMMTEVLIEVEGLGKMRRLLPGVDGLPVVSTQDNNG